MGDAKLTCYSAILCGEAILNANNGLVSYINVHQRYSVPEEHLGKLFPAQAHFDLLGEGTFEVRLVWNLANGRMAASAGDVHDQVAVKGRAHFASPVVKLPAAAGTYWLALEWRVVAADGDRAWQPSEARWPIEVVVTEPESAAKPRVQLQ